MKILEEWLIDHGFLDEFEKYYKVYRDRRVLKEFSMSGSLPWVSWQEFGIHKNVISWCIIEGNIAIGWNENPSRGFSYPIKKLTPEQFEKYMAHTKTYEQYYSLK